MSTTGRRPGGTRRAALLLALLPSACTRPLGAPDADGGVDLAAAIADLALAVDLSAAVDLASGRDLAAAPDIAPRDFPSVLDGVWLIGWSGGLDHYSWVRFQGAANWSGRIDVLDPVGNVAFVGFWPGCEGPGQWMVTQKPSTVWLDLPAGCATKNVVMTFDTFGPPPAWPMGVMLEARITLLGPNGDQTLNGWKFPDGQCDAKFTACRLP